MKFSEGDQVLAKLPSSDEFVKGKVVDIKGSKYKVQVKGQQYSLGETDLKAQRTSRSQTRSRVGRPGKSKSPSRNSPSRKSPARRSPGRSPARSPPSNQGRKLPVRNARQAKISLARLDLPRGDSSDTDRTEESSLRDELEGPSSGRMRDTRPRRSIRIISNAARAEQEAKLASLRDRAASLPLERKYNTKDRGYSVQPDENLKKSYYDDDSDEEVQGKNKKIDQISKPQEWGGWVGASLLMLVFPILAFLLQIACSNGHCSQKNFRIPRIGKEWKTYLNTEAFLLYAGFISFVTLISAIPVGKRVDGQQTKIGTLQYRINGIIALVLSVAGYAGATYYGYNVGDFLLKKSVPLITASLIYATVFAIILYIKGGRVPVSYLNVYGSTNNRIYDFWQGREVNPRFFKRFDVKMIYFRTALIGLTIINLAALVKIYKGTTTFDVNTLPIAAILVAAFQIIYCLDSIILESSFLTTFEVTHEGTGFMLSVGYLTYPFIASVPLRYILSHKVSIALYWYIIPAVLFFGGYYIYRASNSQKDQFRKNPYAQSVKKLETIPTNRGKRLIASSWWGFSRHPNYLGDLMMHAAISILSFTIYDVVPHILLIQTIILLAYRAFRDNARCSKRYGYAWEQYCSKVKYVFLNKVF